jgi:disulfide bond formation protein DsbB
MSKADATDAVSKVLAVGAVLVQGLLAVLAVLALVALVSPRARRLLAEVRDTLLGGELWIAGGLALVATLGSLFYSEVSDFIPCRLCWFQRIAMYPLAVLLLIAAWRRDARGGALYALPIAIAGAGVAIYHIYIEYNPEAESAGCKIGGAACSVKWIEELGYITIPVLALTVFLAVIALSLMVLSRTGWLRRLREPRT